jgi:hypothetical protein
MAAARGHLVARFGHPGTSRTSTIYGKPSAIVRLRFISDLLL